MHELLIFSAINFLIFLKALHECRVKNNAFGLTYLLTPIGAFVWGDAVIFAAFWTGAGLLCWHLADWNLFWLITSVFWVVRGSGETIYWLNEQFAKIERNPPKSLWGYWLFRNDSIWFVYQIVWQCVTVAAIIASIYFAHQWVGW